MQILTNNLLVTCLTCLVLLAGTSMTVNAIENGDRDRSHRNVGAFGFDLGPANGGKIGLCSGFVISDRAFVTAAHCIVTARQLASIFGVDPEFVVSMKAGSKERPVVTPATVDMDNIITVLQLKMLRKTVTATYVHIHHNYDPAVSRTENDVAVLEFPPGTFRMPPVHLARAGFLDSFSRLGFLRKIPVGIVGYGATVIEGPNQFYVPGYRNHGHAALGSFSATRLTLTKSRNFDAGILPGDSGSPQSVLGRVVALRSEGDSQRLDTHEMQAFLMNFLWDE